MALRIIFAGTPEFSVPTLNGLIDGGLAPIAVYTQPDRPAGRGRQLTASPVKQTALAHAIPVYQPQSLRKAAAQEQLAAHGADLMVVVAYGLLLPQLVLDAPRLGCVNLHASLLPRWRGAAPIQRALLAGDRESGVAIMAMEAGLDTGPVYLMKRVPIDARDTGGSLHDKLAAAGAQALLEAIPGIAAGVLTPTPQDEAGVTYASKLDKDEAEVSWSRPAVEIERMIRAFDPWPVAYTRLDGLTLRLWGSEVSSADAGTTAPGTLLATSRSGIEVATGAGVLRITRLQPPGKRAMTAAEFLNARALDGQRFG
jgi:methionyl-tRNA formyltransferase